MKSSYKYKSDLEQPASKRPLKDQRCIHCLGDLSDHNSGTCHRYRELLRLRDSYDRLTREVRYKTRTIQRFADHVDNLNVPVVSKQLNKRKKK